MGFSCFKVYTYNSHFYNDLEAIVKTGTNSTNLLPTCLMGFGPMSFQVTYNVNLLAAAGIESDSFLRLIKKKKFQHWCPYRQLQC